MNACMGICERRLGRELVTIRSYESVPVLCMIKEYFINNVG